MFKTLLAIFIIIEIVFPKSITLETYYITLETHQIAPETITKSLRNPTPNIPQMCPNFEFTYNICIWKR